MKKILAIAAVMVMGGAFSANAQQVMAAVQSIHGSSTGGWSYLTAWNLSTGVLQASPSWYSGRYRFEHSVPSYKQWIARFVYNKSTGKTAALAWYYDQAHVQ